MRSASDYKINEAGEESEFSRSDIDLASGYQINDSVGAFIGCRNSVLDGCDARETSTGPLAGILGSLPMNEALSIFGKATYLFNKLKTVACRKNRSTLKTESSPITSYSESQRVHLGKRRGVSSIFLPAIST
jgi:hypothetical protein